HSVAGTKATERPSGPGASPARPRRGAVGRTQDGAHLARAAAASRVNGARANRPALEPARPAVYFASKQAARTSAGSTRSDFKRRGARSEVRTTVVGT